MRKHMFFFTRKRKQRPGSKCFQFPRWIIPVRVHIVHIDFTNDVYTKKTEKPIIRPNLDPRRRDTSSELQRNWRTIACMFSRAAAAVERYGFFSISNTSSGQHQFKTEVTSANFELVNYIHIQFDIFIDCLAIAVIR